MGDYCKLFARIWHDDDFAGLEGVDARTQLVFLLLVSFDTRNNAGVLPLTIKRWARASRDGTIENVAEALKVLIERRFIVVDWETEEVLIRTFIRNDELYLQPNLMTNALKDCQKVESRSLRAVLQDELLRISTVMPVEKPAQQKIHEDTLRVAKGLVKTPKEGLGEPFTEPFTEPLQEPLPKPPGVGGYVSTVGRTPTPTPEPSPAPTPAPPPPASGVSKGGQHADGQLALVEDEKPTKDKRASRLKDEWRPTADVISRMKARWPAVDLKSEFEKFQNHHIGKGTKWVDWNRCWWNWVAESARRDGMAGSRPLPGIDGKGMEWQGMKEDTQ